MINLTDQEAFDKVWFHLKKQRRRAMGPSSTCCYRAPNGDKCAIGCLIPDEDYHPSMEGKVPEQLSVVPRHQVALFSDLQNAHDIAGDNKFRKRLIGVAARHGLKVPE